MMPKISSQMGHPVEEPNAWGTLNAGAVAENW